MLGVVVDAVCIVKTAVALPPAGTLTVVGVQYAFDPGTLDQFNAIGVIGPENPEMLLNVTV